MPLVLAALEFRHATHTQLSELDKFLAFSNMTLIDLLNVTTDTCDTILVKCRWNGIMTQCQKLFRRVFVAGAFCCSFNYQDDLLRLF